MSVCHFFLYPPPLLVTVSSLSPAHTKKKYIFPFCAAAVSSDCDRAAAAALWKKKRVLPVARRGKTHRHGRLCNIHGQLTGSKMHRVPLSQKFFLGTYQGLPLARDLAIDMWNYSVSGPQTIKVEAPGFSSGA